MPLLPRPPLAIALVTAVTLGTACGTGGEAPDGDTSPTAAAVPPPSASVPASPSPTPAPSPSPSPTPLRAEAPDPATPYEDPAELAAALVAAEEHIRDPAIPADELTGWAWAQQSLYRQLTVRPEWHDQVLAAVPEALREPVRLNLRATVELRKLTSPREELPAWRIIPPPPAEELLDAYRTAADEFGIDWTYLAAIHLVESRMGRIRGDSTAGAKGPMQFLPSTWDAYGEGDIEDPHDAIRAAARYLEDHGAPADMDAAIWAYNHSDRYVQAVKDHAAVMRADERTYLAYHAWQVYYRMTTGDIVLEEGFDNT
ncbi:MAG: transglycosylase SLT domain-containing protein [Actinobacteria bacterium]|nr:transglycosylase SLT domain-containing protein [Actinomycetota bacterium]